MIDLEHVYDRARDYARLNDKFFGNTEYDLMMAYKYGSIHAVNECAEELNLIIVNIADYGFQTLEGEKKEGFDEALRLIQSEVQKHMERLEDLQDWEEEPEDE